MRASRAPQAGVFVARAVAPVRRASPRRKRQLAGQFAKGEPFRTARIRGTPFGRTDKSITVMIPRKHQMIVGNDRPPEPERQNRAEKSIFPLL